MSADKSSNNRHMMAFLVSYFQKFDHLLCLEIYLVVCCQCWFSP